MKIKGCGTFVLTFICIWNFASSSVCTKWGHMCKDDRTLIHCAKHNNRWMESVYQQCDANFKCNKVTNSCVPNYAVGVRFDCESDGLFPDPYQCGTYYVCYWDGGALHKIFAHCPNGQWFSPVSSRCSVEEFKPNPCPRNFNCEYPGQVSVWPRNRNIYYICAMNNDHSLYPKLFRCSDEMIFNGAECVKPRCEC
ncbi:unnamed protein product [Hermetia illucens]|uniref:Chitin-binding type-2 domain-containing protein n=1 Tax=Hermetia illucens TaxID=343691 RepID=A0A7R8YR21_HERIL|nr:uncharacterized protein LOC119649111 [Hermetia illucens]CAD7081045.1 unnamed protein product [Hermetia illucens]